jgi:cytoskeletal protein RodZ
MAFSDMNDVEQELGEEKPPERNGNRTFLIIAGTLGGIMVLALLCIAGLALYRYLPSQQAAVDQNATKAAQDTAAAVSALSASETAAIPTATATRKPTFTPTNTQAPTNTPVLVIVPTKSPTIDIAIVTQHSLLTQTAEHAFVTVTSSAPTKATTPQPTSTALPKTGIGDELGTPALLVIAFVLVVIIFVVRGLRTIS